MPEPPKNPNPAPSRQTGHTVHASNAAQPGPPDWARADQHPLRRKVYALYLRADESLSPKDITVRLFGRNHSPGALGNVAYHVRALVKYRILEPVKQIQVRGTVKNLYRPTEAARLDGSALLDELAEILNIHAESSDPDPRETLSSIAGLLRTSGRSVAEVTG